VKKGNSKNRLLIVPLPPRLGGSKNESLRINHATTDDAK
jgi:hypothetical protein